ncbi:MAG: NADH-quinone oxidoreductase subunit NuoK [Chloroflexi bacterium]|jgi:NADH:ubiquinone oxidoreductase subunit K|uniref:NADH:quinone oxidoreductase/Mrp antiporter membrane subunit domain-containing protein n=1 Tax=marine metagenome TaxID=408172 RepID=A0A381UZJ8_9ZZZZ|nr:NADH-quinone oxidoreductase subunit NuoK [Chloroflexota bacterium]MBE42819.1 NADH-quinone oxidoreductase subunit NuoK [Chloroflexota bacterium]MQG01893.1 NADH-quinone oxidoreductase subunit NuoK [SAR202 cluster bacterium]|tara:strand:+ start:243 stop:593 length:351 start_codon:yes stop_codon:yes gene_type:complete
MTLERFLIIGAILFAIGLYGALSKKHAIAVLMSLELMFNGVNVTAVALSRYTVPKVLSESYQTMDNAASFLLTGQVFAVFIITVAAAEVALGLAIIIAIYRSRSTVLVTEAADMKK